MLVYDSFKYAADASCQCFRTVFRVQVSFKFPRFHEKYAWEVRLSTMNTSGDFCRTCGFEFTDKKRKRNITSTGEFGIIFEAVFKETLSQDDTLPRAVCDISNRKDMATVQTN